MVSSSSVSSYGWPPPSTIANVRPSWPMTCVFAEKSKPSFVGPGRGSSPRARAVAALRTYLLRYQRARPSSMRTPWTMPVPVNQW